MNHLTYARKLNRKALSVDLEKAGDYCIINKLETTNDRENKKPAMILKCPFCRMDMATTSVHTITESRSWFTKLCGYPPTITVSPMIQCPYVNTHKFRIVKGKVLPIK